MVRETMMAIVYKSIGISPTGAEIYMSLQV